MDIKLPGLGYEAPWKNMHPLTSTISRFVSFFIITGALSAVLILMVVLSLFIYFAPEIPTIKNLNKYTFEVPLRVFSAENKLIWEFGEQRRNPVIFEAMPRKLSLAFIAAEDHRFYTHSGVDSRGVVRALLNLIRTGEKGQGASTITMQLARNLWGKKQKTYRRKIIEVFFAFKIESELTKNKILELYLNKIFLGKRANGVQAASHVYYGKNLKDLSLAQMAMIAGLPKAPSWFNPIKNSERALERRGYVLRNMLKLGHISASEFGVADQEPVSAVEHTASSSVKAPYVAEMVRQEIIDKYGKNAYKGGYSVYTTIIGQHQKAANKALQKALLDYDRRHGYRTLAAEYRNLLVSEKTDIQKDKILHFHKELGGIVPGIVLQVMDNRAKIYIGQGAEVFIEWAGIKWARKYESSISMGPPIKKAADVLRRGDLIYVESLPKGQWSLAQVPKVGGALVSMNPRDGAVTALVGGFDFNDLSNKGKFNRVLSADRQPGSNFKPFLYSAALAKGYTPASTINDAPKVFISGGKVWKPDNSGKKIHGPIRMRLALAKSLNLVAIRLLEDVTITNFIDYAFKFGFAKESMPKDLTLALGSNSVTPYRLAAAYAIFANGGYKVNPYFITRIVQQGKGELYTAEPFVVCKKCDRHPNKYLDINAAPRVMDAGVNYQINSMMRGVVSPMGTAARARREIDRIDMAGKTGTTNNQVDAWFSGFTSHIVATVWVGFDDNKTLGLREYGGVAALPAWIDFMRVVLKDKRQVLPRRPRGMVSIKIDPKDGLLTSGAPGAIMETFRTKYIPTRYSAYFDPTTMNKDDDEDGKVFRFK